jgi:three-Cys-motif partner protein
MAIVAKRIPGGPRVPRHRFGGDWTQAKLDVIVAYLTAYTTALDKTPFRTAYVDAFAGSGYRSGRRGSDDATSELLLPLTADEPQELLAGSARIALTTTPRFHRYIFIEKDATRCSELGQLAKEFPELASDVEIRRADANEAIRDLCSKNWSRRRAVLFLDPYGMQVEWTTIVAIAATHAIDLWVLFPLGVGVNRLVTRSGEIPESWRHRLDVMLGCRDWYDAFYSTERSPTLFGDEMLTRVKAGTDVIGQYFNDRLRTVFADVAARPRVLSNSKNCPLYLLCFAVGNTAGAPIALRIANHLLNGVT